MSIKDAFGKFSNKIVSATDVQKIYDEVESEGYLNELKEENDRYLPIVDFSSASNFARYGSAQKYYKDGIENIYQNYPYDGSRKEKLEWRNNSSQIDLYIFDNIYPKSTGYLTLSGSQPTERGYFYTSSYISFYGGPNNPKNETIIAEAFKTANKFDLETNRESNLAINLKNKGNTVEFWYKDLEPSYGVLDELKGIRCILDIWNGTESSDPNYTRFIVSLCGNQPNPNSNKYGSYKIISTIFSKGSGFNKELYIPKNINIQNWNHYAITHENVSNKFVSKLYINGELAYEIVDLSTLQEANNYNLTAFLGARQANDNGDNVANFQGNLGFYGSIDEFRFWKEARSPRDISRYWFTSVAGGSNTDDSNTELGVYYKFNEGIVGSEERDTSVLDYSGRVTNGYINNYQNATRSTSSAINEYSDQFNETPDPIIYWDHPSVLSTEAEYSLVGEEWDSNNNSNIFKSLPAWIAEEQEKKSSDELSNLIQIISSYFDTLHLQIEGLSNVKNIKYYSDGDKPAPFTNKLLSSYNFQNLDLFTNTSLIEELLSRNETSEFETKLQDIKNFIFQNIYNNLSYIYKSKGTEKSIRNLIRCFGVDDELLKLNIYADNAKYTIDTGYSYTSHEKRFVDFNDPTRFGAFICNHPEPPSGKITTGRGRLYAGSADLSPYVPLTVQAEVIFPKKGETNTSLDATFTTVSLFGMHKANSEETLEWGDDEFNFQVTAHKRDTYSKDVYFKLTADFKDSSLVSFPVELTSSWFTNTYENEKWNFAVRIKNEKYDNSNIESSLDGDYVLEFFGVNNVVDATNNKFNISAVIPKDNMINALKQSKRFYVGAEYQDYDAQTLINESDVKISSVRFWYDYLTDKELLAHSKDAASFGRENPDWNCYPYNSYLSGLSILKMDALALNWEFSTVTQSDGAGQFVCEDSSNQVEAYSNDFRSVLTSRYTGRGFNFYPNDNQVVNKEYLYSSKTFLPESITSEELIQIKETDTITKSTLKKPTTYFFSLEKSMSQVINDQILKWFATINSFNNAIGEPINRYRTEYKALETLRNLFFDQVGNTPDYEKFLEFYKWIDSSISLMIHQLIPASSNFSENVRNVVESHMLERNKYENKFLVVDRAKVDIIPTFSSMVNYNYQDQKVGSDNWIKNRSKRSDVESSGVSSVDSIREQIRLVKTNKNLNRIPRGYNIAYDSAEEIYQSKVRNFTSVNSLTASFLTSKEDIIYPITIENTVFNSSSLPYNNISGSGQLFTKKRVLGNYKNKYEYFQTSGRSKNNLKFNDIVDQLTQSTGFFGGKNNTDRQVPDRKIIKTVFVERFSAPGGPEVNSRAFLDAESEEYSVYNGMNNRNSIVRTNLDLLSSQTSSLSDISASFHKVNKNTFYKIKNDQGAIKSVYDNNFIVNQIPRSDLQYAWMDNSVTSSSGLSSYYYNSKFTNLVSLSDSNTLFVSGTDFVDFVGLNIFSNLINVDYSSSTISPTDNSSLNSYLLNLNGAYQGAGWKQIFKDNNKIAFNSRRSNNIISQNNPEKIIIQPKNKRRKQEILIQRNSENFTYYKEPPVEFNSPMLHRIKAANSFDDIRMVSSYDNNKNKFANKDLYDVLSVKTKNTKEVHDDIVDYTKKNYDPKISITGLQRKNIVIPRKDLVTLKEVRTRPLYEDNGATSSVVNVRTYWRDSYLDRDRPTSAYDMFDISTNKLSSVKKLSFNLYNGPVTTSIDPAGTFRESINAQDVAYTYNYTAGYNPSSILTESNITYNYLNKGNLYKTVAEHKTHLLNNIYYNIPNYVEYNLDTNNFYSFNSDMKVPTTSSLPVFSGSAGDMVCTTLSCSEGVYIGGKFVISGSENIILWNGNNFIPLGAGRSLTVDSLTDRRRGVVEILSASDGVYAVGTITGSISRWNGTSWTEYGYNSTISAQSLSNGGLAFPNMILYTALSCSNGGIIVAGTGSNTILRYDGIKWLNIGSTAYNTSFPNETIRTIMTASDGLYVGTNGTWTVRKFTSSYGNNNFINILDTLIGATTQQTGDVGTGAWKLISASNGIYVFGKFYNGPMAFAGNAATVWNTSSAIGNSIDDFIFTAKSASDGIYVGGLFNYANGAWSTQIYNYNNSTRVNGLAKWDGTKWNYLGRSENRSGVVFNGTGSATERVFSINKINNKLLIGGIFKGVRSGPLIKDSKFTPIVEGFNPIEDTLMPNPQLVFNNFMPPLSGSAKFYEINFDSSGVPYATKYIQSRLVFLNDAYIRETEKVSGKRPFFDSYAEFSQDTQPHSQKYSIVPEYRISDYIKEYVNKPNLFNSTITNDYLKLDGAEQEKGFYANTSSNISDVIDYRFSEQYIDSSKPEHLMMNIQVSGIKKLLPKKDFYPSERVLTLSKYFIDSFLGERNYLTSSYNSNDTFNYALSNNTPINGQILTLIQPLFSPGILLNTFKSSIAVDWPVYITSSVKYDDKTSPEFYASTGSNLITAKAKEELGFGTYKEYNYTGSTYLDKDPTFKLPFESLLTFDTIIPSNLRVDKNNLYYTNPTYYTSDFINKNEYDEVTYPSYNMGTGSIKGFRFKDANYQLAMHNFLAEIPNLFLKNNLTKFVSDNSIINVTSGTLYQMDVVLEKDDDYASFVGYKYYDDLRADRTNLYDGTALIFSADSLYGPPMRYWSTGSYMNSLFSINPYNLFFKTIDSPAFAPYVPPYYYGKSIARIKFTPNYDGNWSMKDVLNVATIEYVNDDLISLFKKKSNILNGYLSTDPDGVDNYSTSPAYKNRMNLDSSINLKNYVASLDTTFASQDFTATQTTNLNYKFNWVIQTKFETPSINFSEVNLSGNVGLNPIGIHRDGQYIEGVFSTLFKGLWTSYGKPATEKTGIKLRIEQSPNTAISNCLAEKCGFQKGVSKQIGAIADKKQISEGIVLIPFTKFNNHSKNIDIRYAETINQMEGEFEQNSEQYYYSIDRKIISQLLDLPFGKEDKTSFNQIKERVNSSKVDQNNSIIKLIKSMTKYVIPPHLDWIRNKQIDPFVMYISEFNTTLDTEDLSDIWQGLMPKPSLTAEQETINISHKFAKNELFHSKKLHNDIRFKIFKIKQRANINYYDLTEDSADNRQFKFIFGNSERAERPNYSYNWPYDFMSLVEYVSVEAGIDINKDDQA